MASADELRAQLEVAELEEKLTKAKGTKAGPARELKAELRAARAKARAGQPVAGEADEG
jgi:hypothetical protein